MLIVSGIGYLFVVLGAIFVLVGVFCKLTVFRIDNIEEWAELDGTLLTFEYDIGDGQRSTINENISRLKCVPVMEFMPDNGLFETVEKAAEVHEKRFSTRDIGKQFPIIVKENKGEYTVYIDDEEGRNNRKNTRDFLLGAFLASGMGLILIGALLVAYLPLLFEGYIRTYIELHS